MSQRKRARAQKFKGRNTAAGRSSASSGGKSNRTRQPRQLSRPGSGRFRALRRALGSVAVTLFVSALGLFFWSVTARPARSSDEWVLFDAAVGSDQVLRDLYHEQLIDSPLLMRLYLSYLMPWTDIRPGPHMLQEGLTARELVQRLSADPARPSQKVTIVEGWNRWEVAEKLHDSGVVSREAFLRAVSDQKLLSELAISGESAEGYLFPATYPLLLDTDPKKLVRRLVAETTKRLQKIKNGGDRAAIRSTLSDQDVLILASVVEKETGVESERPRIAQVFLNRLAQPDGETLGRLQSDPTAAYGCLLNPAGAPSCADFSGRVLPSMLTDSQNAYNTYRHAGLPPGPISNPGEAAIEAVLYPSGGSELFFVADGDGGHRFSSSFDEHRKAVKKLREKRGTGVNAD